MRSSKLLFLAAAALLGCSTTACSFSGPTSDDECGGGSSVAVYDEAPVIGAGWWLVADGSDYGPYDVTTDPSGDGSATDNSSSGDDSSSTDTTGDTSSDNGSSTDDGSSDDGTSTDLALHPRAYVGGGCFSCALLCTVGNGSALSTYSSSRTSDGAACRDAQRNLVAYSRDAYGSSVVACARQDASADPSTQPVQASSSGATTAMPSVTPPSRPVARSRPLR